MGAEEDDGECTLILPGEIAAYVQRDHSICGWGFLRRLLSCADELFTEPARFNLPKPYGLGVSDDVWAALKLRVDPLARKILDPHRAYVGAAFLSLLMGAVFAAVRPGGFNDQLGWGRGGTGGGGGGGVAGAGGRQQPGRRLRRRLGRQRRRRVGRVLRQGPGRRLLRQ